MANHLKIQPLTPNFVDVPPGDTVPAHIDIPSLREMERLVAARSPGSVSIYLPTEPTGRNSDAERIHLSNLAAEALEQLDQSGLSRCPFRHRTITRRSHRRR